jgi:hypothetical protein
MILVATAGFIAFVVSLNHGQATRQSLSRTPAIFTVNDVSDGHDGNPGDGLCDTGVGFLTGACTLRAAIEEYEALAGGAGSTININLSGLPAIISASSAYPALTKDVTINGPGANQLKVRGNATFTMFTINAGVTFNISGVSIEGGHSTSSTTGGCFTNAGSLTLTSCNVQGGVATNGGGIYGAAGSTTTINNSSVLGNQATANGGGIFSAAATINLNNSTVALNFAGFGAVINNGGTLTITSSTITANTSPGVFNAGSASLYNTICASNPSGGDLSGTFTSNGHNLIGNGTGSTGFTKGVNGDLVGTNAKLAPLANFGGPTLTAALIKSSSGDSPAIDVGNNASAPATDERGITRPFNGTVDMGAFEASVDMSPATLPDAAKNTAYSTSLSGSNGAGPYSFALGSGSFPTGITMSAAGVIAGTTSQTGTFTFMVVALDANGFGGARSYTLLIPTPTASNGLVSGRIVSDEGLPLEGTVVSLSGAQARKTITDTNGDYRFEDVDSGGFYTVTPSRANYHFSPANRSFSQTGTKTEAVFTAESMGDNVNPLDTPEYFVRQQYLDVLNREPDEVGFNYWSDQILACGSDAGCVNARRRGVATAFFMEPEFQLTGAFIYNLYEGTLGRRPVFAEYTADRTQVVGGANLDVKQAAFALDFVKRAEVMQKYQANTSAESFVNALIQNLLQSAGIDLSSRYESLLGAYNSGGNMIESRVAVMRAVADDATFKQREYNATFVLTEYFVYLRRDPDQAGYAFWLNVLNNGDQGNYRGMVCPFITASEYQHRFGAMITDANGECSW